MFTCMGKHRCYIPMQAVLWCLMGCIGCTDAIAAPSLTFFAGAVHGPELRQCVCSLMCTHTCMNVKLGEPIDINGNAWMGLHVPCVGKHALARGMHWCTQGNQGLTAAIILQKEEGGARRTCEQALRRNPPTCVAFCRNKVGNMLPSDYTILFWFTKNCSASHA